MKIQIALEIVTSLAAENIIEEQEVSQDPEILGPERAKQLTALETLEDFFRAREESARTATQPGGGSDPLPEPTCAGCARPEWVCSADPCADVIADRAGEWELAAESSAPQSEDEEHAERERRRLDSWEVPR